MCEKIPIGMRQISIGMVWNQQHRQGKCVFSPNLQTMQQNASILKLFSKMSIFFKLDFNKIELYVKFDILTIELCVYF